MTTVTEPRPHSVELTVGVAPLLDRIAICVNGRSVALTQPDAQRFVRLILDTCEELNRIFATAGSRMPPLLKPLLKPSPDGRAERAGGVAVVTVPADAAPERVELYVGIAPRLGGVAIGLGGGDLFLLTLGAAGQFAKSILDALDQLAETRKTTARPQ